MAAPTVTVSPAQELQFRRWADDPEGFFRDVVKITNSKGKVVPLDLDERPYQKDCLQRFLRSRICAVLKARQIGLTTIACALALHLLLFHEQRLIVVLSRNDRDAKKFLRRIRQMYDRLPSWVKARAAQPRGKWGVHEVEFDNGSIIYSATSSSDPARGDTPTDIFLDEVGFMRNQDDSWSALFPAVEEGGTLRVFGTAKGAKDWFHLKWLEWKNDPDVDTIFYGWDAIPGRDETWAERTRRRIGAAKFKREYPATDEEAFQTSGSMVFSYEVLDEIETVEEPSCYDLKRAADGSFEAVPSLPFDEEFGLFIFEMPQNGAKYLTSSDPAEGLVESDPSVIQVLKWSGDEIEQVAVYRGKVDPEVLADLNHPLALFYNRALVVVERNNHGHTMLARHKRLQTPNVVRGGGHRPGLVTTRATKGADIVTTRTALADGHLRLHDPKTVDELFQFQERTLPSGNVVYEGTQHDDHVDALCKGVGYAVAHAPYNRPADDPEPPPNEPPPMFSFDWFMSRQQLAGSGSRII